MTTTTDQDDAGQESPQGGSSKTYTQEQLDEIIEGLKANNKRLKAEKVKTEERLNALEQKLEQGGQVELEAKGKYDEAVARLKERHERELAQLTEQVNLLQARRKQDYVERVVSEALREHGGSKLLAPFVRESLRVDEDGDDYAVSFDFNGKSYSDPGAFMGALKADQEFQVGFAPSGKRGGGSAASAAHVNGAAADNPFLSEAWNESRQAEIQATDPARFETLYAEAKARQGRVGPPKRDLLGRMVPDAGRQSAQAGPAA